MRTAGTGYIVITTEYQIPGCVTVCICVVFTKHRQIIIAIITYNYIKFQLLVFFPPHTFDAIQLMGHLTPIESTAAILAAICHDLDHPGKPSSSLLNSFVV